MSAPLTGCRVDAAEADRTGPGYRTTDAEDGRAAFVAKRKPEFRDA